jgi:ATP synthase protein I
MTKSLQELVQRQVFKIVFWQFIGIIVLAGIVFLFKDTKNGLSVLVGGIAYCLPNFIFVWRVFRFAGAQQMQRFVIAFFFGEIGKLFLSAILFVLIVKYLPISLLSVLVGFIGAMIAFWIVCAFSFAKKGVA